MYKKYILILYLVKKNSVDRHNLYTYKTLITLIVCMFVCLFEAVHTNPGYGMAALISNNLFNLISGTVILLRSS